MNQQCCLINGNVGSNTTNSFNVTITGFSNTAVMCFTHNCYAVFMDNEEAIVTPRLRTEEKADQWFWFYSSSFGATNFVFSWYN